MEIPYIEVVLKNLKEKLERYEEASSKIESVKSKILDATLELEKLREEEKNNSWIENPTIILISGTDSPILKVYPYKIGYDHRRIEGFCITPYELIGLSFGTKSPYKYGNNNDYGWTKKIRVRTTDLNQYYLECKEYITKI